MRINFSEVETLLPGYLSGDLPDNDRAFVDEWIKESPENEACFLEFEKAWESMPLLNEMERFNSFEALKKVHARLFYKDSPGWLIRFQRAAAILLIPLLVYSGYITLNNKFSQKKSAENVIMQTVSSRQGMVTKFSLADGTNVWLNSNSELQFPTSFTGDRREVSLKGEAFFEVTKNRKKPFRVNAKDLNIDVLGTSFDVISYADDPQSEVILVEGKVSLSAEKGKVTEEFGEIHPGQKAVFKEESQKVYTQNTEVEKYIAWRDGNLIFNDDPMEEVVKRLSRWFNVEIVFNDPELKSYVYKATFKNENLEQVLKLLKLSAPIDYQVVDSKVMPDSGFTRQKIYLKKKRT